ncbi:hypothetical protein GGF31_006837 [Allomyces arbusculus]|nr:hypothetical protein GGF31_006837 [Allomyces arbusculus]
MLRNASLNVVKRLSSRALATEVAAAAPAKRTALYDFHVAQGAKMVPFAGWDMPLQYADKSHVQAHMHCREAASIFDVSHMLQTRWTGKDAIEFIESLVVGDIQALAPGAATLSLFTNAQGGIIDDTVIQRLATNPGELYVVSNAGCADKDLAHIRAQLEQFRAKGKDVNVDVIEDHSLLALQGPKAIAALEKLASTSLASLPFMAGTALKIRDVPVHVTRCGYTGEDGVEISVPHGSAAALAEWLLQDPAVAMAGLGARDSLRLEAGLCLYGHDMDESVSPVEATLLWTIGKRRRAEGGFLGAESILSQIGGPITKRRVGLLVQGAPAREGAKIVNAEGQEIGQITSGCPSPVLKKNVAMGYVAKGFTKAGSEVNVVVRGKTQKATVTKMPFVPHNYFRG